MPLINCKIELSLKWYEGCLLTVADTATFKITDAKLYYQLLLYQQKTMRNYQAKSLEVYWNKYKVIDNKVLKIAAANGEKYIRELRDSSYQGVRRSFVLAYDNTAGNDQVSIDSYKKYFLPIVKIENYNIEIDGKNFYDQLMTELSNMMKLEKYRQGKGMNIQSGCLLDFAYWKKL